MTYFAARPPIDITEIVEPILKALLKRPDAEHAYWLDRLSALDHLATREVETVGGQRVETVRLSGQLRALIAEIEAAPKPAEGA